MIKNYINGQWVESSETFDTFNPATGEHLATVAQACPGQVAEACEAARAAFPAWANMPVQKRAAIINKIGDLIADNVEDLSGLETQDTGLPIFQTRKALVPRASNNFYFFAEMSKQMNGHTYPMDMETKVGSLISKQHFDKVTGYIRTGLEEGANMVAGGPDKPDYLPERLKPA